MPKEKSALEKAHSPRKMLVAVENLGYVAEYPHVFLRPTIHTHTQCEGV